MRQEMKSIIFPSRSSMQHTKHAYSSISINVKVHVQITMFVCAMHKFSPEKCKRTEKMPVKQNNNWKFVNQIPNGIGTGERVSMRMRQ